MAKTNSVENYDMYKEKLETIIKENATNDAFLLHFERQYQGRRKQWARAFRPNDNYLTIVTSMHVETSFKTLKHKFLGGMTSQRLDELNKAIYAMIEEQRVTTLSLDVRRRFTAKETSIVVCQFSKLICE